MLSRSPIPIHCRQYSPDTIFNTYFSEITEPICTKFGIKFSWWQMCNILNPYLPFPVFYNFLYTWSYTHHNLGTNICMVSMQLASAATVVFFLYPKVRFLLQTIGSNSHIQNLSLYSILFIRFVIDCQQIYARLLKSIEVGTQPRRLCSLAIRHISV